MIKRIGTYLLLERIGRGGMSEVHKARNSRNGSIVALKILRPRDALFVDLVGEERLRDIFFDEAHIMAGIRHENIARIIESGEDDSVAYIALEYFPRSLGSVIGDSTRVAVTQILDIDRTCHYLRQTLCCLEALHSAGIIHRDIKPDNLMLTERGRVKIIDFGLCKIAGDERMVIPGMQIGSPFYTAPEQEADPKEADERSDLFSVGVIAYRLLTGKLVYHRRENTAPPRVYRPELTSDWEHFLLKAVRKERTHRFQSATAMRTHLEELCL